MKKSLQSGVFREGRSGYSKHNFFFFRLNWRLLSTNVKPDLPVNTSFTIYIRGPPVLRDHLQILLIVKSYYYHLTCVKRTLVSKDQRPFFDIKSL